MTEVLQSVRFKTLLLDISFIVLGCILAIFLSSHILKDNQNIYYIFPKEIKLLDKNYKLENNDIPMIDYDTDGVMIWHGVRCESEPLSEEEQKEMADLLSAYQ